MKKKDKINKLNKKERGNVVHHHLNFNLCRQFLISHDLLALRFSIRFFSGDSSSSSSWQSSNLGAFINLFRPGANFTFTGTAADPLLGISRDLLLKN
jgi:hypothetical protein